MVIMLIVAKPSPWSRDCPLVVFIHTVTSTTEDSGSFTLYQVSTKPISATEEDNNTVYGIIIVRFDYAVHC